MGKHDSKKNNENFLQQQNVSRVTDYKNLSNVYQYNFLNNQQRVIDKQMKMDRKNKIKLRNEKYDLMIDEYLRHKRDYYETKAINIINENNNHYSRYDIDKLSDRLIAKRKKELKKQYKKFYK